MDAIYKAAIDKIAAKYRKGMEEHGNRCMEAADLPSLEWLNMLQEEAIDTVFYCEAILQAKEKEQENETSE